MTPGRLSEGHMDSQSVNLGSNPCRETNGLWSELLPPEEFYYVEVRSGLRVQILLNWCFAKANNCTRDDMKNIIALHHYRVEIFNKIKFSKSIIEQQKLVQEIENIEFDLQYFWHISMDHTMHSWWNRTPGCLCRTQHLSPEVIHRIISKHCRLHNAELRYED